MPRASSNRIALETNHYEQGSPGWNWKLAAYLSTWLILAGYLSLLPLAEHQSQLRFPSVVAIIFSAAFLAGGYCLSILICLAFESWSVGQDLVFIPGLVVSSLGLFTMLYHAALSAKASFSTAFVIGILLSTLSTIIYGTLAYTAHRRTPASKSSHTSIALANTSTDPPTSLWPTTPAFTLFRSDPFTDSAAASIRNASIAHSVASTPSHRNVQYYPNSTLPVFDNIAFHSPPPQQHQQPPHHAIRGHSPSVSSYDATRAQMRALLSHRDASQRDPITYPTSSIAAPTTYRIEIPDEWARSPAAEMVTPSTPRLQLPRHVSEYYREGTVLHTGGVIQAAGPRGRALDVNGMGERERSRSREVRRMEIEAMPVTTR